MAKQNYCIDCGAEIDSRATRCRSHAMHHCWKDPDFRRRQSEGMNTEDCKRNLSKAANRRWEQGCYKGRETEEWRRKNSEAKKAAHARGAYDQVYKSKEWRHKQSESAKAQWASGAMDKARGEMWRKNLSKALKAYWENEENRQKASVATKAAWARGDFDDVFDKDWQQKQSEATKACWKRGVYDGVFQSPTSIEIQVAEALDKLEIEHQSQYRPEGYSRIYDEFIPPNILIEIQGDYFHSEEHFPDIRERDAEKAQWATENGFELIEIWEHEINEHSAQGLIRLSEIARNGFT